ncbi:MULTISPECIES: DUF4352 domain-containing protein [Paenibacillus]|uniref:DUF4352 domain-containing protein n=2 Tax=Paenibacillus TaxID=44249 RepID=A0ABX2Z9D4_PAEPO|nr:MULTISPECIES: DUF4352 domain-containing protein [Paenibacillus]MDR6779662.1 hypothetical protein [Paenibacillus peoriae]ODA06732.1 hypothetical protein A7312_14275 [Paenibacillus polymyxa]OME70877.1 hypothetical protein BK119_10800 [Paenibacillus peoriae]
MGSPTREVPKKKLLLVLGAFIAFIALLVVITKMSDSGVSSSGVAQVEQQENNVYEIGETAELGNFAISIDHITYKIEGSNHFLELNASVKNTGDKAQRVSSNMFALIDDMDKNYQADIGKSDITKLTVNPGITQKGKVVFEVPKDVSGFFVAVGPDSLDLGGADYVYFDARSDRK